MKKVVLGAVVAVLVTVSGTLAMVNAKAAPPDSLRGRWVLTLDTPVGRVPVAADFKHGGVGTLGLSDDAPLAYREGGTISISAEIAAASSPTGQAFTMLLRGTRTGDSMSGTLLIITETPDPNRPPADPVKVVVSPGTFTGQRQ